MKIMSSKEILRKINKSIITVANSSLMLRDFNHSTSTGNSNNTQMS